MAIHGAHAHNLWPTGELEFLREVAEEEDGPVASILDGRRSTLQEGCRASGRVRREVGQEDDVVFKCESPACTSLESDGGGLLVCMEAATFAILGIALLLEEGDAAC